MMRWTHYIFNPAQLMIKRHCMSQARNLVMAAFSIGVLGLSFAFWGFRGAFIISLLMFDKYILGLLKIPGALGIEFVTLSSVLSGIVFGPLNGFIISAFLPPVLDGIRMVVSYMGEEVMPFVPSRDNFIDGIAAAISGSLSFLPFIAAISIGTVSKKILSVVTGIILMHEEEKFLLTANALPNIVFTIAAGYVIGSFLGLG